MFRFRDVLNSDDDLILCVCDCFLLVVLVSRQHHSKQVFFPYFVWILFFLLLFFPPILCVKLLVASYPYWLRLILVSIYRFFFLSVVVAFAEYSFFRLPFAVQQQLEEEIKRPQNCSTIHRWMIHSGSVLSFFLLQDFHSVLFTYSVLRNDLKNLAQ